MVVGGYADSVATRVETKNCDDRAIELECTQCICLVYDSGTAADSEIVQIEQQVSCLNSVLCFM